LLTPVKCFYMTAMHSHTSCWIKASLQWEIQNHGNSSCSVIWISEEALYRLLAVHIRNKWTLARMLFIGAGYKTVNSSTCSIHRNTVTSLHIFCAAFQCGSAKQTNDLLTSVDESAIVCTRDRRTSTCIFA